MAKQQDIPQESAVKYLNNIATDSTENAILKTTTPAKGARNHQQKTQRERVLFIKSFSEIVKDNVNLKENYIISFADVAYSTKFYITARDKKPIDFAGLLTKIEYAAYINLIAKWEI